MRDDLPRRLDHLRTDIGPNPLPGAAAARERGEQRRHQRYALTAAVLIAGLASGITMHAVNGRADHNPVASASATTSAGTDQQLLSDGLLQLTAADLPARFGTWTQIARLQPRAGSLSGCAGGSDSGLGLPDASAESTTLPFVASTGGRTASLQTFQWAATGGDAGLASAQMMFTRLSHCATPHTTSRGSASNAAVVTSTAGLGSQAFLVRDGAWGAVAVVNLDGQTPLSASEGADLTTRIRARMGAAHARAVRDGDVQLTAAPSIPNEAFIGPWVTSNWHGAAPLDDGKAPCLPFSEIYGARTEDPRARPETAGDVAANDWRQTGAPEGGVYIDQQILRMEDSAAAERLLTQWEAFITACPARPSDAAKATVNGVKALDGGIAVHLSAAPRDATGGTPVPEASSGPAGPQTRTIYLGRAGRMVTIITVAGVARQPELGDRLLTTALQRITANE